MKKGLTIVAIVVGLLVVTMITVPIIFKANIIQKVKNMANGSVNAKIDFLDVDLSLFKNFPKLSVSIKNLSVTGVDDFDNVRLLNVETLSTTVNISSLWKSDGLSITSILLDRPSISLMVNKAGKPNWDIAKKTVAQDPGTTGNGTKIDLEKIEVRGASFGFKNDSSQMLFALRNGSFDLSGTMKGSNSKLDIEGGADSISFEYGGARYLSDLKVAIKGGLQADFNKMSFTFLQNELKVNKLPLEANGTFVMGEKDYNFDVTFKSPSSSFGDMLGFIPAQHQKYLKGVETKGDIAFDGYVKGTYSDTAIPGFGLNLKIAGGWLKYPNLPKEVDKIEMALNIAKPQGDLDLTKIDFEKFSASVAGNPLKASLHVATPISDPELKGNLAGRVDFATLKQAIPIDSIDIKGIIEASIDFGGRYSSIAKQQYDNFRTEGTVTLKDFVFASAMMPQNMEIKSAEMKLNPKAITLNNLSATMGESDFEVNGAITNYWPYFLHKGVIAGTVNLNSNYLNINQLTPTTSAKDTTAASKPFEVPENVDITVQSSVKKVLYDKLYITGIIGKMVIKDRKVLLDGLSMNMLGGKMVVSGAYTTPKGEKPNFDFKMDIKDFDLPTAYQSVSTVRQYLPVAKESTGSFNTGLSLNGKLGDGYSPNFTTVNGGGLLSAKNIELIGAGLFSEIGKYFRKDMFKQVKVNDFATNFKLVNGGLEVSPFSTKLAGQDVTFSGRQSVTKEIDYRIDFKVNKVDLSEEVTKYVGMVPGADNISKYPIGINLAGTIDKPEVKVDLSEAKKLVEGEFKKKAGSAIQDAAKKYGLDKLFK